MKRLKTIILPAVLIGLIYLVFFQPELLTLSINNKNTLPAGTVISWLFVVVFVCIFFFNISFKRSDLFERILRIILLADVFLSLFWGVISFLLAGNWTFIFENNNLFNVWVGITALILITPVLVFSVKLAKRLFGRK